MVKMETPEHLADANVREVSVPELPLRRLLELLELAARRGAFELDEFQAVGSVYLSVVRCLKDRPRA